MSTLSIGTTAFVDNRLQVRITGIIQRLNSIQYEVSWINNTNDIKTDIVDAWRVNLPAPQMVTDLQAKIN